jgi:hypothetical protein
MVIHSHYGDAGIDRPNTPHLKSLVLEHAPLRAPSVDLSLPSSRSVELSKWTNHEEVMVLTCFQKVED